MSEALPPQYDPQETEARLYRWWESRGFFRADAESAEPPFTIIMPPPNVTGSLHVGHALGMTLQDVLIRWKRMSGCNALWVPGTDHAGIATQMVVERELRERDGISRHDIGRQEFLRRVWEWKEAYGSRITRQIRALGASADWSREYFTMDGPRSRAVAEAFVRLYEQGLIYRADRLINWCPQDRTALSDLEVEHEEGARGELFRFAYPLSDGSGEIVVATTRAETMLGDTAIAVHPDDARYRDLVGRRVRHPILDREIPVIADEILVDPQFGTGAVKVTPAHDFNDFEVGQRHHLPSINLLEPDGTLNGNAGPFAGLDRFRARDAVKERLAELGLARGSEEHTLALGRCQRCGSVVEPYLSLQWWVRIAPLAERAIRAVRKEDTQFVPESWTRTYMQWMENIHDWTISRQLWWGHRIPAWYGPDEQVFVARTADGAAALASAHYGREVELRQDPDVLDTWFSSGLLPFSALGWPDDTADLRTFYPTAVMETGFDIIFFWVARMLMLGLHFEDEVPFRVVFLHAMVRDEHGNKMSKTRGNVIDPLDVTAEYGADALRFALASMAGQGRDINLALSRVAGYQAFANKVWNAARFALMNLEGAARGEVEQVEAELELADRWILSRRSRAVREVTGALERFRFQDAAMRVYAFVWEDLAPWYLEVVKPRLRGDEGEGSRDAARAVLTRVLDDALRLLHPFMPFVTEEIWQRLPRRPGDPEALMIAPWPQPRPEWEDTAAEADFAELQAVIGAVRNVRAEYDVRPGAYLPLRVSGATPALGATLTANQAALRDLARVEEVRFAGGQGEAGATSVLPSGTVVFVPLAGAIDLDRERERLAEEMARLDGQLRGTEAKLANAAFVTRAPAEVVDRERDKLASYAEQKSKVAAKLASLATP